MGWEDARPLDHKAAGPAAFQVHDADGPVELTTTSAAGRGPSPPYRTERTPHGYSSINDDMAAGRQAWSRPGSWGKKTWAIVAAVVAVVLVIVIVVPVEVAKANRYPDYSKLNYSLADTYNGTSFFDNFDYFTGYDPAAGFVHYVPQEQAESLNLTYASDSSAVLRVDTSVGPSSSPDASTGRFSVRVSSKTQYESGLFIFDVRHTPFGCGTWPALWLTDQANWPDHGEIDVMEAVNQAADGNQMTLHTTSGCSMGGVRRKMTGTSTQASCNNATNDNAGCGVTTAADTYGQAYNEADGGVVAMEWRDAGIRVWEFARGAAPADIAAGSPDPSTWGEASADFPGTDCDVGSHFRNQSIIVNIDLCGDWAGGVYASDGCPSNCTDHVANNPDAFTDAYWEFGGFAVYQAS
ncbi:glycoside hydrolase family 16 protein [Xylariaceae sp. FL0804]|nr:glycoside hydrolase family 16 protein [Xylariaceae sp. FL0804]